MNSRQLRNIFKRIVDRDGYNEILGMCGSILDEHFNFLDFKNNLRDFDYKKLNLFIDENGVLILYRPAEFINPRSVSQKCWNYFSDYMYPYQLNRFFLNQDFSIDNKHIYLG